jgi:anthranilate phosphoribosyltransferase
VAVPDLGPKLAQVLGLLGAEHALVVHGEDGMDEISVCAPTDVHEAHNGVVSSYTIAPEQFGMQRWTTDAARGGTVDANVRLARVVLDGDHGPARDVVLLNAGAALYMAGLADSIGAGVKRAADELDSGRARAKVEQAASASQRIKADLATVSA